MIIDNPSISGSISFVGGTNTISATTVSLTGSLTGTFEGSFSTTANANISGAFDSVSSSLASRISSNEGSVDSLNQASSSYALEANISGSFTSVSSSLSSRISSNEGSVDSLNQASSSYLLNTTDTLVGDLTVTGTLTAQEFHTEFVSASILYDSGSTKFGNSYDDVHGFTGSLFVNASVGGTTGSLTYTAGQLTISGDDADLNLDITSGSATANLSEIRFRVNSGTMGRMYMHKGTKHMYLGPEGFPTASLFIRDGAGTAMSITGSNVGIGTTAPTTKLHVQTGTSDEVTDFKVGTAGAVTIARNHALAPSIATNFGSGTANLNFTSNSTLATKISTGTSYFNGGNVGIGTTSPGNQLHIYGTGSTRGLKINATATDQYAEIQLAADSREYRIGVGGSTATTEYRNAWYIYDANAGGHRFLVNSSGQIGIGTSPSYKLDVNGEGRFRSNGASRVLYLLQDDTDSGNIIQFQDQNGSNVWELVGRNNQFYIYNAALGAMSMLINPANSYIGIGTTSPNAKLEVNGNIYVTSNTNFLLFGTNSAVNPYIQGGSDNSLYFGTGNSSRICIDPSGNVGIGTTNPSDKLHIYSSATTGQIRIGGGNGAGNSRIYIDSNGNSSYIDSYGDSGYKNLGIQAATLHLNSAANTGNVGIGTTSPGEKLDVRGNIKAIAQSDTTPLILDSTDSTYATRLRYKAGGTDYWSLDARGTGEGSDFRFYRYNAGWDAVMTLDWANGYVGIQTESPGYTLQVAGSFGATSITETSALRFKKNIVPLESQLDNIVKLNPVTFDWKEDDKHDIGFIAEEVEQIIPDLVSYVDDEVQGLHYTKFTAVLVKAIQEQQKQIEELRKEISILKESK